MRLAIALLVGLFACASQPKPMTYHWEPIPGAVNLAPLEQATGACRGQAAAAAGPVPVGNAEAIAAREANQREVFRGCMYGYGYRRVADEHKVK